MPGLKTVANSELPVFDFDVHELSAWAANLVGHPSSPETAVIITDRPTLAGIWARIDHPRIELHPLFNVEWLPIEVMRHVLIHEHIHRAIPPVEVEPGCFKHHPAEFWEMERRLSPLARGTWCWIHMEWGDVLRRDAKKECVWVKRHWRALQAERRKCYEFLFPGADGSRGSFTTWEDALQRAKGVSDVETLL